MPARKRARPTTKKVTVRARAVPAPRQVVGKDEQPIRICPACVPGNECTTHKHWLVAIPGSTHTDDCKYREDEDE
jgi:hypothetical protein